MYLPPQSQINHDFLKALLKNEKKVFPISEIRFIVVPKLEELSTKKMVEQMRDDKDIRLYLPDEYFDKKIPHREFFYNILNTHYPQYVDNLIVFAQKQRTTLSAEHRQEETIEIHEDWIEKLSEVPFYSKVSNHH